MPEGLEAIQQDLDCLVEWVLGSLIRFKRTKVEGPLLLQDIPAHGRGVQPDDLGSCLSTKMILRFYERYSIFTQHHLVHKVGKIINMEWSRKQSWIKN